MKLTDRSIASLAAPEKGQKMYRDDLVPGFGVRVSQGGSKTYTLIYGAKHTHVTLGRWPVVSLHAAREKARNILAEKQLGIERIAPPKHRFGDILEQYIERRSGEVRVSTEQADGYLFKRVAALNRYNLEDITPADIDAVLSDIPSPSTRRAAYIRLSGLFSWAVRQRYIEHSPVKAVAAPPDQEPRHRVFTEDELRKLMPAIRLRRIAGDHYGAILELLLYTGQRRTQISALSTRNVDRGAKVLQWRSEEMKGKRRHLIPLTDRVAEILDQFPPGANGLHFPNRLGQPFTSWNYHFRKLTLELGFSDFVVHDFRRCVASNMQRLGVDIATTEKLLAHTAVTGGLVAVYQQHTYVTEMTTALNKWADYLDSLC